MHWQGKFVLFEKVVLVPVKITFIGGQRNTTFTLARAQRHLLVLVQRLQTGC